MHIFTDWFRSNTLYGRNYFITSCYVLMGLALAVGTYCRMKGLGKSPFAIDEYYIATSVRNILEHGLPQFDCGGYYTRGVLLQYIVAPLFKYGSNDEFNFRLITVICNLLTVPGLYLLARRISGKTVACLVSILFCLSIWQIEFARFARMYAPFQMLFVWYFYFLYKAVILDESRAKKWLYLISFLSIFVYEGAIFLVLLNFLLLIGHKAWTRFQQYVPSILIFSFALAFNVIDLHVEESLPMDVPIQGKLGLNLPIEMPVFLVTTLNSNLPWILAFLIPLGISVFAIWLLFAKYRSGETSRFELLQTCVFSLFIILSLLNLYGLLAIVLVFIVIVGLMIDGIDLRQISIRYVAITLIAIGITFIFWLYYAIYNDSWRALLDTQRTSLIEHLLILFFKYPPIYSKIVVPWFRSMPVLASLATLLSIFGLMYLAIRGCKERKGYLLSILILLGLGVVMSILNQPHYEIRYTFFLYPILLLVVCISMKKLAMSMTRSISTYRMILAGLFLAFIFVSEDFGIDHLWNIDDDRIIYRIGMDYTKIKQYYPRFDFKNAATIVNEGLKSGDMVVSTVQGVPYYLRHLDYYFMHHDDPYFTSIIACEGKKDLWANANFIYKLDDLLNLLQNAKSTTWLIIQPKYLELDYPHLKYIGMIFNRYKVLQTVDGNIEVYKIPPKKERDVGLQLHYNMFLKSS
jgi:hypothetical protein